MSNHKSNGAKILRTEKKKLSKDIYATNVFKPVLFLFCFYFFFDVCFNNSDQYSLWIFNMIKRRLKNSGWNNWKKKKTANNFNFNSMYNARLHDRKIGYGTRPERRPESGPHVIVLVNYSHCVFRDESVWTRVFLLYFFGLGPQTSMAPSPQKTQVCGTNFLILTWVCVIMGSLRFDDCNVNDDATHQWFDWLNGKK